MLIVSVISGVTFTNIAQIPGRNFFSMYHRKCRTSMLFYLTVKARFNIINMSANNQLVCYYISIPGSMCNTREQHEFVRCDESFKGYLYAQSLYIIY